MSYYHYNTIVPLYISAKWHFLSQVKKMDYCEIDGCTFVNVSSEKNGGALFSDTLNRVYILNSSFTNCFSGFGGAILTKQ